MYIKDKVLKIVSRKSSLAMQQANLVGQQLQQANPSILYEIIGISTSGDEILEQPLNKIGGKGLFVKELENYLLEDKADIAVHSMKDVPSRLPNSLEIAAILERADPRDVFVSAKYKTISDLTAGATLGTSSLRRQAQVLAIRQDLKIKSLRGNIETRLNKLTAGEYDAIILAAAGLERLNLTQWLGAPFDINAMLPAVAQGALGLELKATNTLVRDLIAILNDYNTATCVQAERAMNAVLDGGCQAPIAGYAQINNDILTLRGLVANPDGQIIYVASDSGSVQDAIAIGESVATKLLAQGAGNIIQQCKHIWQKDA